MIKDPLSQVKYKKSIFLPKLVLKCQHLKPVKTGFILWINDLPSVYNKNWKFCEITKWNNQLNSTLMFIEHLKPSFLINKKNFFETFKMTITPFLSRYLEKSKEIKD